jgi:amino acid permease
MHWDEKNDSQGRALDTAIDALAIFNTIVGIGVANVPYAFKLAGYAGGGAALLGVTVCATPASHYCVSTPSVSCNAMRADVDDENYASIARRAFAPPLRSLLTSVLALELFCTMTNAVVASVRLSTSVAGLASTKDGLSPPWSSRLVAR